MEIWKDIPGYGNHYKASNTGLVASKDRLVTKYSAVCGKIVTQRYGGRILSSKPNKHGYVYVHISVGGIKQNLHVGRAVLLAFVGEQQDGYECCHNDGNQSNNNLSNLRWDSHLENNRDRVRHGTYKRGVNHHFSKFSEELISNIKSGKVDKEAALSAGVSNTHYYRILKNER